MGANVYLPHGGDKGFKKLPFFKYYNVMKWQSRFTLQPNAFPYKNNK